MRHPALKQAVVRQALSQGVDRQALVDLAFNGRGVPAEGPLWPKHWAYSTARKTFDYNPEAATLRLDAAGYKIVKRPGAMPSRFRFTCLTIAKDPRYERIASLLQKYFQEIHVDMDVVALSTERSRQLAWRRATTTPRWPNARAVARWPGRIWRITPRRSQTATPPPMPCSTVFVARLTTRKRARGSATSRTFFTMTRRRSS